MSAMFNVILHAGPQVEPTVPEYAVRVLLHLVAFVGLAVLVRAGFVAASAARSGLGPDGRGGSADR